MNMLDLTTELIRFESLSYGEMPIARFIAELLEKHGVPPIFDVFHPGEFLKDGQQYHNTANVYVDIGKGEQTLLLYAHTDVVRAEPSLFQPHRQGDWLMGRGAVDMKASLAGLLLTAITHAPQLIASHKRVIFAFLADEESSGTGARRHVHWLQHQGLGPHNLWCVLTEPTDDFTRVEVGGKGYIFFDLVADLPCMVSLFRTILQTRESLLASVRSHDARFGQSYVTLTSIQCEGPPPPHPSLITGSATHACHPDSGENALEKALLTTKGPISYLSTGNNSPNTLPSQCLVRAGPPAGPMRCRATIDVRTTPEADQGDRLFKALDALFQAAGVTARVRDRGRAYLVESAALLSLCQQSRTPTPQPSIAQGGNDAGYYAQVTPHVIGGFGPGLLRLAHDDAERIHLDVLQEVPQVFARLIQHFLAH